MAEAAEGSLRLDGASTDAGRVQIFHAGQWGTVCARAAEARHVARVACRQLGFGAATGTMVMPAGRGEGGPMWLAPVRCGGEEPTLTACAHPGWADGIAAAAGVAEGAARGATDDGASCAHALGVRCLACEGASCDAYRVPVELRGAILRASEVAPAFYNASAGAAALRLQCARRAGSLAKLLPVSCVVDAFADVAVASEAEAAVADATNASVGGEAGGGEGDEGDEGDKGGEAVLAGLPDPFSAAHREGFVFGEQLRAEYRARRAFLVAHLRAHPADGAALRALVARGALQWNAFGILRQPLLAALPRDARELGLIRTLYLSPRVRILWDLALKP